jgi:hypothetical protein
LTVHDVRYPFGRRRQTHTHNVLQNCIRASSSTLPSIFSHLSLLRSSALLSVNPSAFSYVLSVIKISNRTTISQQSSDENISHIIVIPKITLLLRSHRPITPPPASLSNLSSYPSLIIITNPFQTDAFSTCARTFNKTNRLLLPLTSGYYYNIRPEGPAPSGCGHSTTAVITPTPSKKPLSVLALCDEQMHDKQWILCCSISYTKTNKRPWHPVLGDLPPPS